MPRRWAIPSIAFTGGLGNLLDGFVGPILVGRLKEMTRNFSLVFALLGVLGVVGGLVILAIRPVRTEAPGQSAGTDVRA
ncbi:hypothetical protein [Caballeronia sp. dw_19]|uniref:hypothetical protein n=1 Tax=Caballeronia sp. dw_19 TaxID=2719791 RepID=UPI001BD59E2D|nr:hypothetical protein [Caballeronia sp. dw_19]